MDFYSMKEHDCLNPESGGATNSHPMAMVYFVIIFRDACLMEALLPGPCACCGSTS